MKKIFFIIAAAALFGVLAYLFFVPVFQGRMQINPAMNFGFFSFRWYGLILAGAVLAAYFVARKNSWKFGISANAVDDYSFWAVIAGFLGARLYHLLFNLDFYSRNLSETYKVWHGGLSIYGAVLSGLVFTYYYSRKKAYTFWQLFDLVAISLPLGQAIGRLGNFVNQEAFGLPTNLPWKMYVSPRNRPVQFADESFFHPAFMYEALFDLLVFFVLYKMLGKTKSGMIGLAYLVIYSLGRFFIEAIRLDSYFINGFRVDQVVAFLIIVAAGSLALFRHSKSSS